MPRHINKIKTALLHRVRATTGRPMALICRVLGIGRACAYHTRAGRPRRYATGEDGVVTAQIRTIIRTQASYGARRVRALSIASSAPGTISSASVVSWCATAGSCRRRRAGAPGGRTAGGPTRGLE